MWAEAGTPSRHLPGPGKHLTDARHRPKAKGSWISGTEPKFGAHMAPEAAASHPQGALGLVPNAGISQDLAPHSPSLSCSFFFFF